MAIFLLIRHGENDWVGKKLAGRLPGVHLNKNGLTQAEELASSLRNLPIKAIYSSPLERAMETAQPLAEAKALEINICENLSEINFGNWQGKNHQTNAQNEIMEYSSKTTIVNAISKWGKFC